MLRFWVLKLYPCYRGSYLGVSGGTWPQWFTRWQWWWLGFSGYCADESFGRLLEGALRYLFVLPSTFILDRWWAQWIGAIWMQESLEWLVSRIYYKRLDILFVVHLLCVSLIGVVIVGWFLWWCL